MTGLLIPAANLRASCSFISRTVLWTQSRNRTPRLLLLFAMQSLHALASCAFTKPARRSSARSISCSICLALEESSPQPHPRTATIFCGPIANTFNSSAPWISFQLKVVSHLVSSRTRPVAVPPSRSAKAYFPPNSPQEALVVSHWFNPASVRWKGKTQFAENVSATCAGSAASLPRSSGDRT
jgi:hypothetical protein